MTNENIIYNAAVNSGLFSASEAQAIVASGRVRSACAASWRRVVVDPGRQAGNYRSILLRGGETNVGK